MSRTGRSRAFWAISKLLGMDIDVTRRERRMRRLLQKVAILELEIGTLRQQLQARDDAPRKPD